MVTELHVLHVIIEMNLCIRKHLRSCFRTIYTLMWRDFLLQVNYEIPLKYLMRTVTESVIVLNVRIYFVFYLSKLIFCFYLFGVIG